MTLAKTTAHKMDLVIHAARFLQKNGDDLPDFVDMAYLVGQILADSYNTNGDNGEYTGADLVARLFKVLQAWQSNHGCCSWGDSFGTSPMDTVFLSKLPITTENLIYQSVNDYRTNFTDANRKSVYSLLTLLGDDVISPYTSYRHEDPIKIDEEHCSVKFYNESTGAEATVILTDRATKLLAGH
jgi:hypothetical protein